MATDEHLVALRIKPDFAEASFNLGNGYGKQGRVDKAIN